MIKFRIESANAYLEDAKLLYERERYNSAMSRLYYASYQAMWSALGDPEDSRIWKHLAIIKPFVHGYWFNPAHPGQFPGLLEHFRLPMRRLYAYRIKADYELEMMSRDAVKAMIDAATEVIKTVLSKGDVK